MRTEIFPLTSITSAGPQSGVSVASISGDFTLTLRITQVAQSFVTPPGCRCLVEESVNSWGTATTLAVVDIPGPIANQETIDGDVTLPELCDQRFTWRKYQISLSMIGVANSQIRLNFPSAYFNTSSISVECWIDN